MSPRHLVTAGCAVLALGACAWFAVSIRQANGVQAASSLITGTTRLPPATAGRAANDLSSARLLNPDTQVDVLRAELDLGQGHAVAARRILERVVAKEPENAVAWEWLARASAGKVRELFLAGLHIRQLVPPVPPPP
jgi:hypothetical protein